jgi:hypothetical protein
MSNYILFRDLLAAETEAEVDEIIRANRMLVEENNWKPIGGFRGNFSQINNQQGNPIPALVEKPINSIDAILIKECKLRGINPESPGAPKSIKEAIEQFFEVRKADFSEVAKEKRREIAESIQILATGSKPNPNICIYDDGEGQHPSKFEDTFLSLTKDNKLKIKFVQGKYNMGETGVIPSYGEKKYQLILSRKHTQLLDGQDDLYGFTLTRLHSVTSIGEYKNSWFEYCLDADGKIFSFQTNEIDVGLFNRKFVTGTFIKLYNYDLPRRSDITLDLWRDLNRYLYSPALPILLYEKRDFRGKSPDKVMLGNRLRVMIDDRELKENSFPIQVETEGIKFPGEITVFKDGVDKSEFVDKMAIIFTINGQVHDHLTNAFITHSTKLPYLSGSILANFDCTTMPTHIREQIFMPSRDRMRENSFTRQLKENISRELRDNTYLRKLNELRRDQKVFNNPKDDDFMKRVMTKLLKRNEDIAKILGLRGDIRNKIKKILEKKSNTGETTYEGKRFPTYVKLHRLSKGNIKMIPQNGECKLQLETDVEDEYLIRSADPGELKIKFLTSAIRTGNSQIINPISADEELFDVNIVGPNQGEIMLRIKSKLELPIGTEVPLDITLTSPSGDITCSATIKVLNPIEESKKKNLETKDSYSLPKIIEVYRENKNGIESPLWSNPDYNWTGLDICKIFPSGESNHLVDALAINMDADVIHDYMRQKKLTDKNVEHLKRLHKVAVFLISLMLYF